jgi:large subunit ribosomal protein L18e
MKNQQLTALVSELKKVSRENNVNIWDRVASDLNKPARLLREVNLTRINRYCEPNEIVVVPGKVLSMGTLDKKVTIAAYKFSSSALNKIKESGSSAISIYDLIKKNPKGSKVRIIG